MIPFEPSYHYIFTYHRGAAHVCKSQLAALNINGPTHANITEEPNFRQFCVIAMQLAAIHGTSALTGSRIVWKLGWGVENSASKSAIRLTNPARK